jgi:AcrR family transcriptional regulator
MVHQVSADEAALLYAQIVTLERDGWATRTFRRLDPDRQLAVIEAILAEAAARGPRSLAVKRVAAQAGVAVGSLYQYFPDREGMVKFAAVASSRFLIACFNRYRPTLAELPLRDALTAYLGGGVEWGGTYAGAGLLRFFARAAYQGDMGLEEQVVKPVALAMHETVRAILVAARARGEVRADVDLEWAARIVHALIIAVGDSQLFPHLNAYFRVVPESLPGEAATVAALDFILAAVGTEERS